MKYNWKNRKVAVTGAGGFIGSHLVEELCREGARVSALVHYNSKGSWGWIDTLPSEVRSSVDVSSGDILDPSTLKATLKGCETVFHLAALIAIPYSYRAPSSYVATNVNGTQTLLEVARDLACERVVVTSTSEVYGTALRVPIDESHPRQGQSPYSASKIGADAISEAYGRSFEMPITTVRPFNTYGPRQSARAIIPTIATQLLSGATEVKIGSTTPTRDFLFVKDTVKGFLAAASCEGLIRQEVNLCTGSEISIGELGQNLIEMINPKARLSVDVERVRPEKSEVNRLIGSSDKIRKLTDWAPEFSLRQGLESTVSWLRENLVHYKSGHYNV